MADKREGFKYKTGRPKLFETPEEFTEAANAYFKENDGQKISWTGLVLAVGASCRQTLEAYKTGKHGEGFIDPVKKALATVENYYEECVDGAKGIFILKNFGMRDNLDINADVNATVSDLTEEEMDKRIAELQEKVEK